MLYGLWENFYIEFSSNLWASLSVHNIFFSFGKVINFKNQCYRIRDVTVFAILIQISLKLINVRYRLRLSGAHIY